ncbi:hypothetical protein [Lysinibacillus parviboronicapiens]|uniref:hypothetical protein n=1 Tax=Lysinibacillus parviboronicapiens TaxID=436516 RepID=UPI000D39029B|nr:hypothetical protein [Lysinibacillus parviboronicapiens]
MLSKRVTLLLVTIVLLIIAIMIFAKFSTKNFVDEFIPSNDFEGILERITIWEKNDNLNESIAILNQQDARLDEVRLALNSWQIKRTLFKDIPFEVDYQLDIFFYDHNLEVKITQDGFLFINGYSYELVSGSFEELLEIVE